MEISTLMYARSLAGHDKGKLYVIWQRAGEYVYLTDGALRPTDKPKKKKIRHIQVDTHICPLLRDKIDAALAIRDEDIRKAIKIKEVTVCQKQT